MASGAALLTVSRYRIARNGLIALFAAALLAGAVAIETHIFDPAGDSRPPNSPRQVADGAAVPGASTSLLRTNEGIAFSLKTSGLPTGHVIVVRALVFNQPRNCTRGVGGARCGTGDIDDPAVDGSIMFVTGFLLRQGTAADVKGNIAAGDAQAAITGHGLTSPHGADVHLIIADHGLPISGMYSEQLATIGGGCKDAPPGSGPPGPNACPDLQVSINEISGD